jgi:hypothetical protein
MSQSLCNKQVASPGERPGIRQSIEKLQFAGAF